MHPIHEGRDAKSRVILLATDGTSQTESAVEMAKLFSAGGKFGVHAITVVEQERDTWGVRDRGVLKEYQHSMQVEAREKVSRQLFRAGVTWPIEVQTGDPATIVTSVASLLGARIIITGLGEHGAMARLWGVPRSFSLVGALVAGLRAGWALKCATPSQGRTDVL